MARQNPWFEDLSVIVQDKVQNYKHQSLRNSSDNVQCSHLFKV
jgi:hypothetical protein